MSKSISSCDLTHQNAHNYRFDGFRFESRRCLLVRESNDHPFALTPKESSLLLALVERAGELVSYDELRQVVWAGREGVQSQTIRETKRTLCQKLGATAQKLETASGKGYRFDVAVEVIDEDAERTETVTASGASAIAASADEPALPSASSTTFDEPSIANHVAAPIRVFAGHTRQAIAGSALYAALYAVALLVEVAYEFDVYGIAALKIVPFVFAWMFGTSFFGLHTIRRRASENKTNGLTFALLIFVLAAIVLYFALGLFLPSHPITQADFQTYTAHGAYLKSVAYFLFIAIPFLIIPFHFVHVLQNEARAGESRMVGRLLSGGRRASIPTGAIYLRVWWLGLLLIVLALLSPALMSHLFENLKPAPYMNLFIQLVEWRVLLYLGLATECLLWYYSSLNAIKGRTIR